MVRNVLWLSALLWLVGCGGAPILYGAGSSANAEWFSAEYQIHPNDQLDITIWGHADLSSAVRIREDGTFTYPLIGTVLAQGRTLSELEYMLVASLADGYLRTPTVNIRLLNPRFSILGEVEEPGTYELTGPTDLLAAISMAGGLSKFGSSRIELIRTLADGRKISADVDINAVLAGRRETIAIQPHDTVHAKRRMF